MSNRTWQPWSNIGLFSFNHENNHNNIDLAVFLALYTDSNNKKNTIDNDNNNKDISDSTDNRNNAGLHISRDNT